jgi:hypothetical protein
MAEQAKFCYDNPMNQHQEYMRWLHSKSTKNSENQVISRTFKNSSGADELISLPQSYWGYVDWLEARGDIIFSEWVIHCEMNPHEDTPISHLLMYWLWLDECGRWMNCQPTPSTVIPNGFRFWKAEYGNRVWTAGCGRI